MDNCSYFIKNKALFGSFPTQDSVNELENNGVRYFVNLTYDDEKLISPYVTNYEYITYPISDNSTPTNWYNFSKFLNRMLFILKYLKENDKIYIHCKGGHGRSSIVVVCLLVLYLDVNTDIGLNMVNFFHKKRKNLKDKWKRVSLPQNIRQRKFLENFFKPMYFFKAMKNHCTTGFSNFSLHNVYIEKLGLFPTSESAFNAHLLKEDDNYVKKHLNSKTPFISRKIYQNTKKDYKWKEDVLYIMKKVIRAKIEQNTDFKFNLLNTGFRKIVFNDKHDKFWGIGDDNNGENNLGKILCNIRDSYYVIS